MIEGVNLPPSAPLQERVRALLSDMYRGYLAGNRSAIDRHLAPDLTMFDSASPGLVSGMDELDALRAGRGSDEAGAFTETALAVERLEARRIGSVVSAQWWLRVDAVDAAGASVIPELTRNSAVLVERDGALLIAHLHEDVWQPLGGLAAGTPPDLPRTAPALRDES